MSEALRALQDPLRRSQWLREVLEGDADQEGSEFALGLLETVLKVQTEPEAALQTAASEIQARWPVPGPRQKAALLTLLVVRGALRPETSLSFDARTLAAVM